MNDKITAMWNDIQGKKIVLYGADASGLAFLREAEERGLRIEYFADRDESKQGKSLLGVPVKSPMDLMYEDPEDLRIVITAPGGRIAIEKALKEMGFDETLIVSAYAEGRGGADYLDSLLGISRGRETLVPMKDTPGGAEKKILTIGGSTTDPYWDGIHSWPWFLQKLCDEAGFSVEVINAGVMGYTSSAELLVLLRDGVELKPDLVISFSGYNDYSPSINVVGKNRFRYTTRNLFITWNQLLKGKGGEYEKVYYGEEKSDLYDIYAQNVRVMHGICTEFGAGFMEIFQPSVVSTDFAPGGFVERVRKEPFALELEQVWKEFYGRFREDLMDLPYVYDFSRIFCGRDDVLVDLAHVTEDGNMIIAEEVLQKIREDKLL